MSRPATQLGQILGVAAAAAVVTFVGMNIYIGVISNLPRPMQGEAVRVPWRLCLSGLLLLPVLLPWLTSTLFIRGTRLRIAFLLALCAFVLLWYVGFGFDDLLSKAWRRGL